jgi:hypothetical protein
MQNLRTLSPNYGGFTFRDAFTIGFDLPTGLLMITPPYTVMDFFAPIRI